MSLADKQVYPSPAEYGKHGNQIAGGEGITLLEHYAGLAMQAIITTDPDLSPRTVMERLGIPVTQPYKIEYWYEYVALDAVGHAQALIAQLEKSK